MYIPGLYSAHFRRKLVHMRFYKYIPLGTGLFFQRTYSTPWGAYRRAAVWDQCYGLNKNTDAISTSYSYPFNTWVRRGNWGKETYPESHANSGIRTRDLPNASQETRATTPPRLPVTVQPYTPLTTCTVYSPLSLKYDLISMVQIVMRFWTGVKYRYVYSFVHCGTTVSDYK
jgi:hypothetical protein